MKCERTASPEAVMKFLVWSCLVLGGGDDPNASNLVTFAGTKRGPKAPHGMVKIEQGT